jgi:hypothetical protein
VSYTLRSHDWCMLDLHDNLAVEKQGARSHNNVRMSVGPRIVAGGPLRVHEFYWIDRGYTG